MQKEDRNKAAEHFWHNALARPDLEGKLNMLEVTPIIFIRRKGLTETAAGTESERDNIPLPLICSRSQRFGKKFGPEQLPVWLFVKRCLKHSTQRN